MNTDLTQNRGLHAGGQEAPSGRSRARGARSETQANLARRPACWPGQKSLKGTSDGIAAAPAAAWCGEGGLPVELAGGGRLWEATQGALSSEGRKGNGGGGAGLILPRLLLFRHEGKRFLIAGFFHFWPKVCACLSFSMWGWVKGPKPVVVVGEPFECEFSPPPPFAPSKDSDAGFTLKAPE